MRRRDDRFENAIDAGGYLEFGAKNLQQKIKIRNCGDAERRPTCSPAFGVVPSLKLVGLTFRIRSSLPRRPSSRTSRAPGL